MFGVFEMNDLEVKILEEVKNGRTEFLFSNGINDVPKEELQGTFMLKNFGYIHGEDYTDEDKFGYVNVTLTDKGKYCFMTEEEIKNYESAKLKNK
ncbi:hypothetical protein ACIQXF_19455 [Lysinibacillus sp. NPDC097231]|uniref:hypothetical protein n=1 Tax=Lysinibacillus sp. NPDC097231 TaxID=3364142 RepID=UPI00381F9C4C